MNTNVKEILMNAVVHGTFENVQIAFNEHKLELDDSYFDYELLKSAFVRKHTQIAIFLLDIGCRVKNPFKGDFEETPLHLAMRLTSEIGEIQVIEKLLEKGASIYDKNPSGKTPLHAAFLEEYYNTIHSALILVRNNFNPENIDDILHFHIACLTHNIYAVKRYLECGLDPDIPLTLGGKNFTKLNPIQFAIETKNFGLFKCLIKYSNDLSIKNDEGLTPLHMTYYADLPYNGKGWIEEAFKNAKDRRFINSEDKYRFSHFHLCCMLNEPAFVQAFIDNGVDVNSSVALESPFDTGFTALHFAVENGHKKVIKVLLKNGAAPNKTDIWGVTPLNLACRSSKNSKSIIKLLLEYKASPIIADLNGFTPLHMLIYYAKKDGMPIFDAQMSKTEWGSINYTDKNGLSLFHVACTTDNVDRVKNFLDLGVNIDRRVYSGKSYSGFTALHFAVMYNQKDIVQLLLKRKAKVNVKTLVLKITPLHLACEYLYYMNLDKKEFMYRSRSNQLDIINLLLSHGAHVDAKDSLGTTPLLHTCIVNKNCIRLSYSSLEERGKLITEISTRLQETIKILILNKANVNARTAQNQSSILHIISACKTLKKSETLVKFLINSGVDVNAVDAAGWTPLHVAVECSNKNLVRSLLKHNANPNIKCNISRTPLYIVAEKFRNNDDNYDRVFITEKLLDYGADININDSYISELLVREHEERTSPSYGELFQIIFIHVQKLLALGLPTSEKLQKCCVELQSVYKNELEAFHMENDLLDNVFKGCLGELNDLKNIKIDRYTSLHDILLKDPHEVAKHVNNSRFINIINIRNECNDYSYYEELLHLQVKRGLMRRQVLKSAEIALTHALDISLPDLCFDSVLSYLDNKDIVNLKKAVFGK